MAHVKNPSVFSSQASKKGVSSATLEKSDNPSQTGNNVAIFTFERNDI